LDAQGVLRKCYFDGRKVSNFAMRMAKTPSNRKCPVEVCYYFPAKKKSRRKKKGGEMREFMGNSQYYLQRRRAESFLYISCNTCWGHIAAFIEMCAESILLCSPLPMNGGATLRMLSDSGHLLSFHPKGTKN